MERDFSLLIDGIGRIGEGGEEIEKDRKVKEVDRIIKVVEDIGGKGIEKVGRRMIEEEREEIRRGLGIIRELMGGDEYYIKILDSIDEEIRGIKEWDEIGRIKRLMVEMLRRGQCERHKIRDLKIGKEYRADRRKEEMRRLMWLIGGRGGVGKPFYFITVIDRGCGKFGILEQYNRMNKIRKRIMERVKIGKGGRLSKFIDGGFYCYEFGRKGKNVHLHILARGTEKTVEEWERLRGKGYKARAEVVEYLNGSKGVDDLNNLEGLKELNDWNSWLSEELKGLVHGCSYELNDANGIDVDIDIIGMERDGKSLKLYQDRKKEIRRRKLIEESEREGEDEFDRIIRVDNGLEEMASMGLDGYYSNEEINIIEGMGVKIVKDIDRVNGWRKVETFKGLGLKALNLSYVLRYIRKEENIEPSGRLKMFIELKNKKLWGRFGRLYKSKGVE